MLNTAQNARRKLFWSTTACLVFSFSVLCQFASAQQPENESEGKISQAKDKATTEPVFRVSKLNREKIPASLASSVAVIDVAPRAGLVPTEMMLPEMAGGDLPSSPSAHPLDKAIALATSGLEKMRASVSDYSAILVKRERINGAVSSPSYMRVKVRCPRQTESGTSPFSVYMKFLKPKKCAGREVIWVDGKDDNKLCVHESGLMGMKRFYLDPNGWLAMQHNRYPVYEVGIENLIIKLIEKASRDKSAGMCEVTYRDDVELMKRKCSLRFSQSTSLHRRRA
jgi:hypothetical protein